MTNTATISALKKLNEAREEYEIKKAGLQRIVNTTDDVNSRKVYSTRIIRKKINELEEVFTQLRKVQLSWKDKCGLNIDEFSSHEMGSVWFRNLIEETEELLDSAEALWDTNTSKENNKDIDVGNENLITINKIEMQSLKFKVKTDIECLLDAIKGEYLSGEACRSIENSAAQAEKLLMKVKEVTLKLFTLDKENAREYGDELTSFEEEYHVKLAKIKFELLSKLRNSENQTDRNQVEPRIRFSNLKKQDPPRFDGNVIKYPEFKRKWRSIVSNNFDETNEESEIDLLKENLPNAAAKILTSVTTRDNAWILLDKHFGNKKIISQKILSKLDQLKVDAKKDCDRIIEIYLEVQFVVNSMNEMKMQNYLKYNDHYIAQICKLLPERIRYDWLKLSTNENEEWDEFYKFLEVQYEYAVKDQALQGAYYADTKDGRNNESKDVCFWCKRKGHKQNDCFFKKKGNKPTAVIQAAKVSRSEVKTCPICNDKHTYWHRIKKTNFESDRLSNCPTFRALPIQERGTTLESLNGCSLCTSWAHEKDNCPFKENARTCSLTLEDSSTCKSKHHKMLCGARNGFCATVKLNNENEKQQLPVDVLLQIQSIKVNGSNAITFWDSGSNRILIRNSFAESVGLTGTPATYYIQTVGGKWKKCYSQLFQLSLEDLKGKLHHVWAFGIDKITDPVARVNLNHIKHLFPNVPDSAFERPFGEIDILIGINFQSLHPSGGRGIYQKGNLRALKNDFGWIISGSCPDVDLRNTTKVMAVTCCRMQVKTNLDFINSEDLGVEAPKKCLRCKGCRECSDETMLRSRKEQSELDLLISSIKFDEENKHFVVKYPFIKNPLCLSDNRQQVIAIQKSVENSLKRKNLGDLYNTEFNKYIERGAIVKIEDQEMKEWIGPVNYISHHAVFKESKSTPCRLVSNSSLNNNGQSLNSCLPKGPNSLSNLFSVLIRFRSFEVALVWDLTKAYQSLYTGKTEKHLRRLVWRHLDEDSEWKTYAFNRVQFGDKPAAVLLELAKRMAAEKYSYIDEHAAHLLKNCTYVDDTAGGGSLEEVLRAKGDKRANGEFTGTVTQILAKAGLKPKTMVMSGEDDKASIEIIGGKVLGYSWKPYSDELGISIRDNNPYENADISYNLETWLQKCKITFTKRNVLKIINQIYDPLGLASPITIKLKLEYKKLFGTGRRLDWDELIPEEFHENWRDLMKEILELKNVAFRRSVKPSNAIGKPTLIGFCDGSLQAYAACVYVKWMRKEEKEPLITLLCGKARVTPKGGLTVPKSELNGLLLLSRLMKNLIPALEDIPETVILISDSECVISTIEKTNSALSPYFHNRVIEIINNINNIKLLCNVEEIHHTPGLLNPSDIATRDQAHIKDIMPESFWQSGPNFLKEERRLWNISRDFLKRTKLHEEYDTITCFSINLKFSVTDIDVYKSLPCFKSLNEILEYSNTWKKAVRICARVLRAWKLNSRNSILDNLSKGDITDAEKILMQAAMIYTRKAMNEKKLDSLLPFIYENLIVTSGRLGESGMKSVLGKEWLVILSSESLQAKLIMKEAHNGYCDLNHRRATDAIARSRRIAWIVGAKALAKSIVSKCMKCRLFKKKITSQRMGILPIDQLQICPPWTHVSLDFAGPINVRDIVNMRTHRKCWIAVYVCRNTKAVKLMSVAGYSTSAFLNTHRRFLAECGCPKLLVSDRGSQLVKADKVMRSLMKDSPIGWSWDEIADFNMETEWKFVDSGCQWQNGLAEAQVKSLKKSLDLSVSQGTNLTISELDTLLSEIANVINSRPLSITRKNNEDILSDDFSPITPNMLLLGRSGREVVDMKFVEEDKYINRLAYKEDLMKTWWKCWFQEVFPNLVPCTKWRQKKRNIQAGDIVLIKYKGIQKGEYRLGRVIKEHPDENGVVHSVTVGITRRDSREQLQVYKGRPLQELRIGVHRLCVLLPIEDNQ